MLTSACPLPPYCPGRVAAPTLVSMPTSARPLLSFLPRRATVGTLALSSISAPPAILPSCLRSRCYACVDVHVRSPTAILPPRLRCPCYACVDANVARPLLSWCCSGCTSSDMLVLAHTSSARLSPSCHPSRPADAATMSTPTSAHLLLRMHHRCCHCVCIDTQVRSLTLSSAQDMLFWPCSC